MTLSVSLPLAYAATLALGALIGAMAYLARRVAEMQRRLDGWRNVWLHHEAGAKRREREALGEMLWRQQMLREPTIPSIRDPRWKLEQGKLRDLKLR